MFLFLSSLLGMLTIQSWYNGQSHGQRTSFLKWQQIIQLNNPKCATLTALAQQLPALLSMPPRLILTKSASSLRTWSLPLYWRRTGQDIGLDLATLFGDHNPLESEFKPSELEISSFKVKNTWSQAPTPREFGNTSGKNKYQLPSCEGFLRNSYYILTEWRFANQ